VNRLGGGRAYAAVAGAAAVLAACLAAGPLFLSSASTAATRVALSGRCPGLVDASYRGPHALRSIFVTKFAKLAAQVPHSGPPIVTDASIGVALTLPHDDGLFRSAIIVHRSNGIANLDATGRAGESGVYVPDWFAQDHHIRAGQKLVLSSSNDPRPQSVPVLGAYADVVAGPRAQFWCSLEPAFQPNAFGDHRPPVLILDDGGAAKFRPLLVGGVTVWELPLVGRPTASSTAEYLGHLGPLERAGADIANRQASFDFQGTLQTEMTFVVHRAAEIRKFTGANIAPVRWSGAMTGGALVLAAALLFVRRNRREYRIRILRGTRPSRLGMQAAARVLPAVVVTAAIGAAAAGVLIQAFGPTSDIDGRAIADACAFAAIAMAATVLVVALTVTFATRSFDRERAARRAFWKRVPFELAGAALVFVAFRHLVDTGGVQLAGSDTSRIDPWAVLFPLLLVWTILIALGRPLLAVLKRVRTVGLRGRPAVTLGIRRAIADPMVGVATSGAVAFCLATFVYASTLSTSIEASLQAKSHAAVGADLRVALTSAPHLDSALAKHATFVTRAQGKYSDEAVTVIGVDRSTFAHIAFWRRSFGGSLDHLLARLRAPTNGAIPVVIAGASGAPQSGTVAIDQGQSTAARVVGRTALWPTMQPGDTFVIADKDALARRGLHGIDEVWVKGLPLLQPTDLAGPTAGVVYAIDLANVLDSSNSLPVRWSLGLLGTLGAVAGLAFAAVELAMVDSRARARQLAYLLWRRMGLTARQHRIACLLELGLPVVLGATAAIVTAVATARLVIVHLDALPSLPPPAGFVWSARPFVFGGATLLIVLAALVIWSQRVTRSGDPLELIRVAE
jgi:hypothetical protein